MTLAPRLVAPAPPRALAVQEQELRDFLENAIEGVHKLDADGRIAWANRSALERLGYTSDEYLGHHIGEFHVNPAEADLLLRRLLAGETVREMPAQLRCRDGSIRRVLELRKTQVELTAAVADALEAARPLLDAKHHLFTLQLPPDPIRLRADPVRLAQIFANLLINAAKYTDTGGRISLTARREADSVCVSVRDNGIGIEPAILPRLFELFSQGTAALERSEGGLGVGLALVRGLLVLHGGSIEVHSEGAGCGSEFTVRLPLGPEGADSGTVGAPSERRGHEASLRVLVADDNRDAAETCAMLLQLSGHEVQVAHSGRAALEAAERFRPHVALLDIGMPELSGYDIASRIRAAPWGAQVTLIAVTGWGQEEDRKRALSSGFDRHLVKPIDPVLLEQLLREIAAGGNLRG